MTKKELKAENDQLRTTILGLRKNLYAKNEKILKQRILLDELHRQIQEHKEKETSSGSTEA